MEQIMTQEELQAQALSEAQSPPEMGGTGETPLPLGHQKRKNRSLHTTLEIIHSFAHSSIHLFTRLLSNSSIHLSIHSSVC